MKRLAKSQSLGSAPATLQDHTILVERITRLQQPLQYEREYIAETRFTGETPVAEVIAGQVPGLPWVLCWPGPCLVGKTCRQRL